MDIFGKKKRIRQKEDEALQAFVNSRPSVPLPTPEQHEAKKKLAEKGNSRLKNGSVISDLRHWEIEKI